MELNPNFYNNAKKACENQSEFKNYKELCQALGEPVLAGDSKIAQLAKWHTWLNFEKDARSTKFKNVFLKSVDEHDTFLLNQFYSNQLACIFSALLYQYSLYDKWDNVFENIDQEALDIYHSTLYFSYPDLFLNLGLLGKQYKDSKKDVDAYSKTVEDQILNLRNARYPFLSDYRKGVQLFRKSQKNRPDFIEEDGLSPWNVTKNITSDVMDSAFNTCRTQVNTMLNAMYSRGIASFKKVMFGAFVDKADLPDDAIIYYSYEGKCYAYKYVDADGKKQKRRLNYTLRELTGGEENTLTDIQSQAIMFLNCTNLDDVKKKNKENELATIMDKEMLRQLNMLYSFSSFKVTFNPELVRRNYELFSKELKNAKYYNVIRKHIQGVNQDMQDRLIANHQNRQDKSPDKVLNTDSRNVHSFVSSSTKTKLENLNLTHSFIFEKEVKQLSALDLDKLYPPTTPEEYQNYLTFWKDLFDVNYLKLEALRKVDPVQFKKSAELDKT